MKIDLPMASVGLAFHVGLNENPLPVKQRKIILDNPVFGTVFTDHMVDICWSEQGGWHRPRVQPYGPIPLDPAASVLHYGQEIFEGMKAYRHEDGSIWTFRPEENAKRLQRSAKRMALPELPVEYFLQSLKELIAVDGDWVPSAPETSLYMRPFMFAKEAFLGVRPAKKVAYYLIASPVGPYFGGNAAAFSDGPQVPNCQGGLKSVLLSAKARGLELQQWCEFRGPGEVTFDDGVFLLCDAKLPVESLNSTEKTCPLFPLDSARRFAGHIQHHTVDL